MIFAYFARRRGVTKVNSTRSEPIGMRAAASRRSRRRARQRAGRARSVASVAQRIFKRATPPRTNGRRSATKRPPRY